MRHLAIIALGLTMAASPLSAQTGFNQAPVPGPFMIINRPQPAMPAFTPQRFAMPMPYWMQNTPRPQQQALAPVPPLSPPAVGRANQQPADAGWTTQPASPNAQNNGNTTTPGFFPSYNSGPQQAAPRPSRPAGNYGAPYPTNNFAPMPWNQYGGQQYSQQFGPQYGGQQGFMPMPWQNGQNGWGNNWNNNGTNNGNGSRQGYAAPNWPQQ